MAARRVISTAWFIPVVMWLGAGFLQGQPQAFTDDFARPDGPVTGWRTAAGTWAIAGEKLSSTAAGTESWIWAGDPPILATGEFRAQAAVTFGNRPAGEVGRHGGLMFFASKATTRADPEMSGYTIDWIDRVEDHGFRLLRIDPGTPPVQVPLMVGTPALAEPPASWEVEIDGDLIRVLADGALIFEVPDATYREGRIGAWAYSNGTNILLDDVDISYTGVKVNACFTASRTGGNAPLAVDFDASCSTAAGAIASYDWNFGDGKTDTGAQVSNVFEFADTYTVTLTVKDTDGNQDTATTLITVRPSAETFTDDFAGPDGPPAGWTVYSGNWGILQERLGTTTAGAEDWIWAGDPPVSFPENINIELDYEFVFPPADVVGRHAGVMFCATAPTQRYDPSIGGYTVDWIDRVDDHGFRLLRIDPGNPQAVQTALRIGTPNVPLPPEHWRITVEGNLIRVFGDGVLMLEAIDSRYRGGFFGVWAYSNSQVIAVDNVDISTPSLVACFDASPGFLVQRGTDITLDAGCSVAKGTTITNWDWTFGDGQTGSGQVVEHTYPDAGDYRVKLAIRTAGGSTAEVEQTISVFEPMSFFFDDFTIGDGPVVDWTIRDGIWNIEGERLVTDAPAAPETWVWAGDPAHRFVGVQVIQFDIEFLLRPGDAVGRHGGFFFFAENTEPRWGNSGYSFDWIDRIDDHGYRFIRWDNGVPTNAQVLGSADPEPAEQWRIEIDGDAIRLIGDGDLKGEIFDAGYRSGHVGFWSYFNSQRIAFDNVQIGEPGVEPPLPPSGLTAAAGDGQARLDWTAPAAGAAVSGYNVYQTRPGARRKLNTAPVAGTTYTAAALPNGTEHCFVVRSIGTAGSESGDSNEACATPQSAGAVFKRGDTDANGAVEITDPINLLGFLFLGEAQPPCFDAADVDDNGSLEITDAIASLGFQFLGEAAPPAPGPLACGPDPTPELPGADFGCAYPAASCQ